MIKHFHPSITSQSYIFFEKKRVQINKKLVEFSGNNPNLARFTGLPIGVCFTLLSLAQTVSSIAESLIKGIFNIFGFPFSDECRPLTGVKQLFLQLPLKLIYGGISCTFEASCELFAMPIGIAIKPVDQYSSNKRTTERIFNLTVAVSMDCMLEGSRCHGSEYKVRAFFLKTLFT